jgi:hypothetical protein
MDNAINLNENNNHAELIEEVNTHIESYSKFVNNSYFEEIYSQYKTPDEIQLLKDYSTTHFQINNEYDLENFLKLSNMAETIMSNTDGMQGFAVSFSQCFNWHIQEIIRKIKIITQ